MSDQEFPRITHKEAEILRVLIELTEAYGLQIIRESKTITRTGLYVTLGRMEDKGFVTSRQEHDPNQSDIPRRYYKPTGLGEKALNVHDYAQKRQSRCLKVFVAYGHRS